MNDITPNLLIIVALIFANAFFVAAEFALVRVRRTRMQQLIEAGSTAAEVVRNSLDNINEYRSATQVGITLASLALGWIGEPFLANLVLMVLPAQAGQYWAHAISVAVSLFMITYLHVVVGELMPKSIALQHPEALSLYLARPMRFCILAFRPLTWLLTRTSTRLLSLFGIHRAPTHTVAFSEEELLLMLSESKKAGVVSEDEQRMLQRVFKFHDKKAREIMVPRPDVTGLDLRASETDIQHAFEQGYSRLPAYDGTLNNIKGIVYVKDLIYTLQNPKLIKVVDLLREAIFVPESKAVPELLREFQRNRMHMAIVIDEFGDTAGIVTLEDVIEEIVGEIQDEYDAEPVEVQRAPDGSVIFEGKTDLDRFKEIFPDFELPEGDFETVAGLIFQLAGRVPREGDTLQHDALKFKVLKREGRRLRKIGVWRTQKATAAEESKSKTAVDALPTTEESAGAESRATGPGLDSSESHRMLAEPPEERRPPR